MEFKFTEMPGKIVEQASELESTNTFYREKLVARASRDVLIVSQPTLLSLWNERSLMCEVWWAKWEEERIEWEYAN
jgi:hypothetical protein